MYIDAKIDIKELQALIDKKVQNFFEFSPVDAVVFPNENYQVSSNVHSTTYPVDRSRYYVEIEPALDRHSEKLTFDFAIAQLVRSLRKDCDYVVASCDFEDYIVEQTGWNWGPDNPLPPR